MGMGDAKQRSIIYLGGAAQEIAENMVAFGRTAGFDVAQHRGGQQRTRCGERGPRPLEGRLTRRVALRRRDRGAFIEQRSDEIRGAGGDDVADRSAHQAGDAGALWR